MGIRVGFGASSALPEAALAVLRSATLAHVAVHSRSGPHVTPMVFVEAGGRVWVTTARSTVKARAWRRRAGVAVLVRSGDRAVTLRGVVRSHDALDPGTWPGSIIRSPQITKAMLAFSLKNARFFAGYAFDARRVPLSWTPPGRVFAEIEPVAGRVLDLPGQEVVDGWGAWPEGLSYREATADPGQARSADMDVPADVRRGVGQRGEGALALPGRDLTVLPAAWRRSAGNLYVARLPEPFLRLANAAARGRTALAINRTSSWRASEMMGMLLRGPADALAPPGRGRDGHLPRISIRPDAISWWRGWSTGTVRSRE